MININNVVAVDVHFSRESCCTKVPLYLVVISTVAQKGQIKHCHL